MQFSKGDIVELKLQFPYIKLNYARGIVKSLGLKDGVLLYHIVIPPKFIYGITKHNIVNVTSNQIRKIK